MLKLVGRADASGLARPVADDVWRVCLPEDADSDRSGAAEEGPATSIACLLRDGQDAPPGYGLYLIAGHEPAMPGRGRVARPRGIRHARPGAPARA